MKLGLTIEFETWRSFNVHHQRILLIYPHILTELRIGFKTRRTSNGFGAERKSGFYSILLQKSALLKGS